MPVNVVRRHLELRDFLMRCRARLHPRDVGLSSSNRRRVPGLRREEVAELVGVSSRWYELFESGTNDRRFSTRFIQRVADVLRLDDRERAILNRLALPEVAAAIEMFERSAGDGALQNLAKIRDFSRHVIAASSFEDAALAAIEAVQSIVLPNCITEASFEVFDKPPYTIAAGPRAQFASSVFARTVLHVNAPVRVGATTICNDAPEPEAVVDHIHHQMNIKCSDGSRIVGMHDADATDYIDYNSRLHHRSGQVVGLFERGKFRGNMGCFWTEQRTHSDAEIDVIETVASILELSATPQAAGR